MTGRRIDQLGPNDFAVLRSATELARTGGGGHNEVLDTLCWCAGRNKPDFDKSLYHAWVEARATDGSWWLVDFSPKYWPTDDVADFCPPWFDPKLLRPIDWVAMPPDEFVGPLREINYRLRRNEFSPPLGRLTLLPLPPDD